MAVRRPRQVVTDKDRAVLFETFLTPPLPVKLRPQNCGLRCAERAAAEDIQHSNPPCRDRKEPRPGGQIIDETLEQTVKCGIFAKGVNWYRACRANRNVIIAGAIARLANWH